MKRINENNSFKAYVMGNYALARAMIETGTKVITSYPGSPTPEIAQALSYFKDDDFYFEFSSNEKVAIEKAFGASINGHLSCCFFKSVGLNVASDSFIQLSMMNLIGGMVIIIGDDPGANSSQNEQDNRHFSRMSYIPMIEPTSVEDAYLSYKKAVNISKKYQMPIILRITTHIAHSKGIVEFGEIDNKYYDWKSFYNKNNGPYVPVASTVFPLKTKAIEKIEILKNDIDFKKSNFILNLKESTTRLIVSSGLAFSASVEAVKNNDIDCDIMKLGFTYPIDKNFLKEVFSKYDDVIIIEELDRVIETEIKAIAFDLGVNLKISAKKDKHLMRELGVSEVLEIISDIWNIKINPNKIEFKKKSFPRFPQLCPGCGHRSAFFAIKNAIDKDDITVADIGCHTLGFLPPYEIGEILLSMGHSVSTASGLAIKNKNRKVIAFMGDSTFFHAGLSGFLNASILNTNIILIILENGTTAMTGHQPRLGTGEVGEKINLEDFIKGCGVKFVKSVDAYNQSKLKEYLKEAKDYEGFSVIIAHHPCMLKFTREMKIKNPNYKPSKVEIDEKLCGLKKICVSQFGCPSFVNEDKKVSVNEELCIGDGSCIQTCPDKAIRHKREVK
ncbi:MAG: indolepyruvate ferredoxin oxidoreductase subunit alpha [Elusimicrobiales bacterium]|nr:indolepyruvate ferredoxin oxidoreductase subunit alpha [Elusimicrobiales bacterium]